MTIEVRHSNMYAIGSRSAALVGRGPEGTGFDLSCNNQVAKQENSVTNGPDSQEHGDKE